MIEYHCDSCRARVEHPGPDLPREWAGITIKIDWAHGKSGCQQWETENPLLLCTACRGAGGDTLEARIENILRTSLFMAPVDLADETLRIIWRNQGGEFHGPNVETGTMPEARLLPFLRELLKREANNAP